MKFSYRRFIEKSVKTDAPFYKQNQQILKPFVPRKINYVPKNLLARMILTFLPKAIPENITRRKN